VDDPSDRQVFLTVLHSFEKHLPLAEPPNLVEEWEYLYERSIGCVGVLKDWLVRALTAVLRRNAAVLTHKDLQAQALSASQCEKMLSETLEGEGRLLESAEARNRLRVRLGLSPQPGGERDVTHPNPVQTHAAIVPPRKRGRPGLRRPGRDVVGQTEPGYACATGL
jgi:hypothetical protein